MSYIPGRDYKGLGRGGLARQYYAGVRRRAVRAVPRRRVQIPRPMTQYRERGGELKFLDTAIALTFPTVAACSTTAATGNIHIVPQGDGGSEREGRKITIKSINLKGNFTLVPGMDAASSSVAYLYVVLDTQCNGNNPAITDVLTSNDMQANFANLANDNRFRIMKKFIVEMSSTAGVTTAYNNHSRAIDWYKKCNIDITYDNTAATGAVTTTRINNIFLIQGSGVDNQIAFTGAARIRFTG